MAVFPVQCLDAHGLVRTTEYPESLCLVWVLPTTKMTLKVISEDITLPSLSIDALRAAGPFTPRIARMVTPSEMWHHYVPESGNWHDGTFTRWIAALSAAPNPCCHKNFL